MNARLSLVSVLVRDYDEAIAWYGEKLGFKLERDEPQEAAKRWVVMAPPAGQTRLLLARAANPRQAARIGDQTGGRIFLFLETDGFKRDYDAMKAKGVHFVREPKDEPYGVVAVFEDICGNLWDLIEHKPS